MGQSRLKRAGVNFQLMTVRVEEVGGRTFALILLPDHAFRRQALAHGGVVRLADTEGDMRIVLARQRIDALIAGQAQPERPGLQIGTISPCRAHPATKHVAVECQRTVDVGNSQRKMVLAADSCSHYPSPIDFRRAQARRFHASGASVRHSRHTSPMLPQS